MSLYRLSSGVSLSSFLLPETMLPGHPLNDHPLLPHMVKIFQEHMHRSSIVSLPMCSQPLVLHLPFTSLSGNSGLTKQTIPKAFYLSSCLDITAIVSTFFVLVIVSGSQIPTGSWVKEEIAFQPCHALVGAYPWPRHQHITSKLLSLAYNRNSEQ